MLLKKIVVAEDDDDIAHMVNMALGDAGFLCLRARNGEEALRLVRMHSPDALILDVMMPAVDGIEVVKRLRADQHTSRIPVLMLTALIGVEHKIEGLEAGADDYVTKPFDLRELSARVNALIRAARRERERNPTTDLPGSEATSAYIAKVRKEGVPTSLLHIEVVGFGELADRAGYSQAEATVKQVAAKVVEVTRQTSGGSAFVGHLGGVDFIAATHPDDAEKLAKALAEQFDANPASWLGDPAQRAETAAETVAELVATGMWLAVGVVPADNPRPEEGEPEPGSGPASGRLSAQASDQIARRLAQVLRAAKKAAKERAESSYVVWRPEP